MTYIIHQYDSYHGIDLRLNIDLKTMKSRTNKKITADEIEAMPCISLILPYESWLKNKSHFYNLLASKADDIEKDLLNNFPEEMVASLITQLRNIIKTLQCPASEKSIGIFISPVAEKVYFFTPSHLEDYKLAVLVENLN